MPPSSGNSRDARGLWRSAPSFFWIALTREQLPLNVAIPKDIGLGPFAGCGPDTCGDWLPHRGHYTRDLFALCPAHVRACCSKSICSSLSWATSETRTPQRSITQKQRGGPWDGRSGQRALDVLPGRGLGRGARARTQ